MARGYDCECGEYIEAENDARLTDRIREHVQKDHKDTEYSDAQLRQMTEDGAYDVRAEG
jgi:predicted small metal-binding protein